MNTKSFHAEKKYPTTTPRQLQTAGVTSCLLLLATLLLPTGAQAQFTCVTNNGAITITGWTGSDGDVTIPDTINGLPVTSVGEYAFHDNRILVSVTIPDGVTNIDYGAFWGCRQLAAINLPNSVTSIGDHAIDGCWSLPSIAVPSGVTRLGAFAFADCLSLTNVILGDQFPDIGEATFWKCVSLPKISIPKSVTSIGERAFWECYSLRSIAIPGSVTNIGSSAFFLCTYLTNFTFLGDAPTLATGGDWFYSVPGTVYYYYGTSGWGLTYGGLPTVMLRAIVTAPILAIEPDGGSGYFISFSGVPGSTYRLQRAPTPAGPWSSSVPQTAPASGVIEFWDLFAPPGQAFYRSVQP